MCPTPQPLLTGSVSEEISQTGAPGEKILKQPEKVKKTNLQDQMVFTGELHGNPKRKVLHWYPPRGANLLFKASCVEGLEAVDVMQNATAVSRESSLKK